MEFFLQLIGKNGLMLIIGLAFFLLSYRYSIGIFDWIERQTLGTRNYILENLEIMFIDIKKPEYVTYLLLFLSFGLSILTLGFFGLFGKWVPGIILAITFSIIGWKIPKPLIKYLIEKRIKNYQGQMVDALNLLSNGLRAGLSVPQAIGMVVDELPAPVSEEFNLILQQNRIGVPLEECFESLAKRIPTEDNDMFVSSVNILRETGGNLAETFDTIVAVIRERIRLQQKIDTYTAQGMFQGYTIFAMPFAIGGIFFVTDPELMSKMFSSWIGYILLFLAIGLDLAGLFVIMKIVKIKV